MKLLYAEDEISMSEAVKDILEYHNYSVDAVYDGEEALEFVRLEHYDGIILDVMMPKLNGLQVLQKPRAEGELPQIVRTVQKSTPKG
ncbi:MAG: response regulator [Anaeromassilibacillus sp.]|nr:response regulator [Anaeromassilibacillus sp.]MDY3780503.1 response regulator [Candidatus Limousia pullorum]